jgi:inorganic phosphate transporter, PiT family
VFSLFVSAIIWNVGTWYLGLPASSSHTLIGSIIGVGMANSYISGHGLWEGVNWPKVKEVFMALLISPVFGFVLAGGLLLLLKVVIKDERLFKEPDKDKAPPLWIRCTLIGTCSGVSLFHGSNDGQKGMGLIVLILVGLLPATYALKMDETPDKVAAIVAKAQASQPVFEKNAAGTMVSDADAKTELQAYIKPDGTALSPKTYAALAVETKAFHDKLAGVKTFSELAEADRIEVRKDSYLVAGAAGKILKGSKITADADKKTVTELRDSIDSVTKYIPDWVKVAVAIALGLGTTIGWKRIVVTVGEKIGKTHLTYGQGASAELVAMATIAAADYGGLPVSTTHVLSSGVAGTMAANKSGLQMQTLRNLLLAWVLTLPVCVLMGSILFAFANNVLLHWLGM